jgi:hypothetical protein
VVTPPENGQMTGGRQSDYALIKQGDGELALVDQANTSGGPVADYRFSGGTTIEAGSIKVESSAGLHSDVDVQPDGQLALYGGLTGNVSNNGSMLLFDTIAGDVVNAGTLTPGSSIYGDAVPAQVQGNFSQTPDGTLVAVIGATTGGFLSVTGRADIDGTLQLEQYADYWGSYPLPATPVSLQVLHADGGVFGQFAQWTSPGLFVTGAVRYLPNDVYFDATAISAAEAMAAARAGDAITLGSAVHFDAALGGVGGLEGMPPDSLTDSRRRFLASAGAIQRLQDWDQAARTFDSLSGYGYAAAADALLQQASMPAADLMSRMASMHTGSKLGAWSGQATTLASGTGAFNIERAGFDQWLGDGLVLGSSVGWSDGSLRFERMGANTRDRSPQWDVYVQRFGAGDTYLFGDFGYSSHRLDSGRSIDLGIGRFAVRATNNFDLLRTYLEGGRSFRVGAGQVSLFGALSYAELRGAGFVEQGGTGFEFIAQPSSHQRTSATAGLRLGQEWRTSDRSTTLNLAAGYSQLLSAQDNARAAFTGAPDVTFALAAAPMRWGSSWMQLSLGTGNERWNLQVNYERQAGNQGLSFGTHVRF